MIFPSFGTIWTLVRTVERLAVVENKYSRLIEQLHAEVDALSKRMDRLEAREELVVVKAEGAARTAAMGSATAAIADIARRLGAMEERGRQIGGSVADRRLPDET